MILKRIGEIKLDDQKYFEALFNILVKKFKEDKDIHLVATMGTTINRTTLDNDIDVELVLYSEITDEEAEFLLL